MRKAILAGAVSAASAAWGMGLAVGVFGGTAFPEGDMTATGVRRVCVSRLEGGDAQPSGKLGGRALLGVTGAVDVEVAASYHFNHDAKSWSSVYSYGEEPTLSLIPVTLGARYNFRAPYGRFYLGAGAGYFFEKLGLSGGSWYGFGTFDYYGEVAVNAPGAYVAAGITYRVWNLEFEAGPRFTSIWNSGEYDYTYEARRVWPTNDFVEVRPCSFVKDYNDTYVDLILGASYYIF
jgi:outer membrane protein W